MTRPPDGASTSSSIADLARTLAGARPVEESVVHARYVPGTGPVWAAEERVPGPLGPALSAVGIQRLYAHQAEALALLDQGRHVLAVTPTASGKSLVYMLPTLERLAKDPEARALYLFPFKALEQDQLASLQSLLAASGLAASASAAIYDGDTPPDERRRLRAEHPSILLTNPDMLHLGLLPRHEEWRAYFQRLEMIVVDELHVYRGVFGSHMHHVMRRLARVCRHHGAAPRVIASSATIGNPEAFASSLLGVPLSVVADSGAPRPGRHFLFVNPARGSPYTAAAFILARCVREGFRTIVFTKARKITELLASWVAGTAPDLAHRIASYRAGYLPSERRAIEQRLASGDLAGVITTSALEHGIDIGGLDVCILVGYPGSIMSSWQRLGRAGRSGRDSLVILIALQDALDQYFMSKPGEFFERGCEPAAADPANPVIASQHLICAASEIPLQDRDRDLYGETFGLIQELTRPGGGLVEDAEGGAWCTLRRTPQRDVGLRSIGAGWTILDVDTGRPIGTIDGARAYAECHQGAVYLHRGQQHEVVEMDHGRRRILARRVQTDLYTQVQSEKETEILEVLADSRLPTGRAGLGRLRVTQEFKQFARRRIADQRIISYHPLDLPPLIYETVGLWWEIPESVREACVSRGAHFMGSLHASEHAAISLFPLLVLCDRGDIGGISYTMHPQTSRPAVFIYDGTPGGIGLAARGFTQLPRLLSATLALVSTCPCEQGCPSCIHSPKCGSGNHPLDKSGARAVLERLLAPGPAEEPVRIGPAVTRTFAPATRPYSSSPPPVLAEGFAAGTLEGPGPREAGRVLFFDLETRRSANEVGGWGRVHAMGLALAIVFDERTGTYRTYFEADVDRLLVDLMSADRVVGFNLKRFDYAVLRGYRDAAFERIPTFDLLEEIHRVLGCRVSLGRLAEATLSEGKSADGLQSLRWFKEGRLDLIEQYCRKDVEVTRRLYHFGRERGFVLVREEKSQRPLRVPVSW